MAYTQKGMYEEAIAEFRHPSLIGKNEILGFLGVTLVRAGKKREAITIAEDLQQRSKQEYIPPYALALIYCALGDKDKAFVYLEKGRVEHDGRMYETRREPAFDSLRSDPRFADLMRSMA